jgi:hypothetical protein
MFAAMVAVTLIFVNTRSEITDGRPIWPRSPVEWPTYLLLGGAFLSFATAVFTMIMFCCCYERSTRSWKLALFINGIEVLYWVIVTIVYRKEKQISDLWGWSCSEVAQDLQRDGGSVHFDKLCTLQTISWYVSIFETVLKIVFLMFTIWLLRKLKKETAMLKIKIIDTVGGAVVDGINNFLI